jgi:hypothetical protein
MYPPVLSYSSSGEVAFNAVSVAANATPSRLANALRGEKLPSLSHTSHGFWGKRLPSQRNITGAKSTSVANDVNEFSLNKIITLQLEKVFRLKRYHFWKELRCINLWVFLLRVGTARNHT